MQALLATRVPAFSGGTHKRCAQAPFQEIADTLMKAEGTDEDGTTVLVLLNNLSQLLIQEINGIFILLSTVACTNLQYLQRCTSAPLSPHPCQHLSFVFFDDSNFNKSEVLAHCGFDLI